MFINYCSYEEGATRLTWKQQVLEINKKKEKTASNTVGLNGGGEGSQVLVYDFIPVGDLQEEET